MTTDTVQNPKGISRRKFLKILGTASAVSAVGCATDHEQKVYPRVKTEDGQIPGVAVWYSSTCTECSSGCGVKVKTVDGRAIKVEGDKESPISHGGLCALGQASLQSTYDPDRVRQPLKRTYDAQNRPQFKPVSWEQAFAQIADAIKNKEKKSFFFSGETTGAIKELTEEFLAASNGEHVVYDSLQPTAVARASELVYGVYGVPLLSFEKADTIVNFGADFLETWVSPVEYASGWASKRRSEKPQKFIQIEPRLSLTGANADMWACSRPGTEVSVALALLSELMKSGASTWLAAETKAKIVELIKDVSLDEAEKVSGVPRERILLIANYLRDAKGSIVVAGGPASSTSTPLPLLVAVNLINVVLGNVGNTIHLAAVRRPQTSIGKVSSLIQTLNDGKGNVLFVHGTNPAFSLPSSFGFSYAARKAELVVSFSSHLDETAQLADLILPAHTGIEMWGDVRQVPGVYTLVQPAMSPVFDTKDIGDMLLEISAKAGVGPKAEPQNNFESYLKSSWKKLHKTLGVGEDFEGFWRRALEKGGYFETSKLTQDVAVKISPEAFTLSFQPSQFDTKGIEGESLVLYPFVSVKAFDGRAANRPWMQELPDPMTAIVWDSWVELHPETAKGLSIAQGDPVTIRNFYGEVNVPAYLTDYIAPGVVAIPVGQGHQEYGRFAKQVGGANVFELLPAVIGEGSDSIAMLSTKVTVRRGPGKYTMVSLSGSPSQLDRELARTRELDPSGELATVATTLPFFGTGGEHGHAEVHGAGGHGEEEKEPKKFAEHDYHGADNAQRNHDGPKQMYLQREHPVYEWGMSVDLAACTGCSACVVACYAENNIPVVGKDLCDKGREMSWLRIERYYDSEPGEELRVSFLPMMCQHCHNAPCEPVCPVYATYHNEEGLNAMVYNRCVGTRYCSNNCSYKVRRFNWVEFQFPEPLNWQLNPDVTKRSSGVMEKCSFCVQRIIEAKDKAKDMGRLVEDGEVQPACVQSCPTEALVFGNLNDPNSAVSKLHKSERSYKILDKVINTQPAVGYLEDVKYNLA